MVFHDHETGELLELADSYEAFLRPRALSLEDDADDALQPDTAVIARTEKASDSILNPIRLKEWTALVERDPAFSPPADRSGVSPLNQQAVRLPRIGTARFRGRAEAADVELVWGALRWPRPGAEGAEKARMLAQSLGARLLCGRDVA